MDSFTLPLKFTCRISGKVVTYTNEDYVKKRLEKYGGSLKRMQDEFVCRDAKRDLKDHKTVEQIRTEAGTLNGTDITTEGGAMITIGTEELINKVVGPIAPVIKHDFKLGKPIPMTKEMAPRDACWNPGWFLNKSSCALCAFTGICNYEKKRA